MKVLFYNWVDYEDPARRGGGVSVYQQNVIDAALNVGDVPYFLSSGIAYSLLSRRPRIRKTRGADPRVRKFEVVNSPVLSPGGVMFGADTASDPAAEAAFAAFLRAEGPFDAVHFNNLEGIPLSFLRVAREHAPAGKVVLSLHNYFPFCPQVNLWFQEKENCVDFAGGKKCVNCLPATPRPHNTRKDYIAHTLLARLGIARRPRLQHYALRLLYDVVRPLSKIPRRLIAKTRRRPPASPTLKLLDRAEADRFAARRAAYVDALNRHADHVLAVSERVAEIAVRMGVERHRVSTAYIGTKFAGLAAPAPRPARSGDAPLSLGYLGYMRRDKGFYWLLQALEKMPPDLAARLRLTFAAKVTDEGAVHRLRVIAHRFAAATLVDGYTHATLPALLAGIDLGIVPVLWEDNLPQVAIEFVGSGVPVLTSDLGGASEILRCPELTFRAGSRAAFYRRLGGVLASPGILESAMAGRARLVTTAAHYRELRELYYSPAIEPAVARAA